MARWKLRGCPRCGGDVFIDIDLHGYYEECLQCSYARYMMKTGQAGQRAYNEKEEGEMAATLSRER